MATMNDVQSFSRDLGDYVLELSGKDNGYNHDLLSGILRATGTFFEVARVNRLLKDDHGYWDSLCRYCFLLSEIYGRLPDNLHTRMILSKNSWARPYSHIFNSETD